MDNRTSSGTLYIVATPIGNLKDITFRAVETLKSVDLIAAEDTRHSKKLLNHYGITARLISCHEHNEIKRASGFIEELTSGKNIALISDAGTPTISDPGYKLVTAAVNEGIDVIPIPGCSAAIAGLSVSGLPTDTFLFTGFLPKKKKKQESVLADLKTRPETLIFYESPKRIVKLLKTLISEFGDRQAFVAREITKIHEEYLQGSLSDIAETLTGRDSVKGEYVLCVKGQSRQPADVTDDQLAAVLKKEMERATTSTSDLAAQMAERYQLPKKKVYNLIVKLKKEGV